MIQSCRRWSNEQMSIMMDWSVKKSSTPSWRGEVSRRDRDSFIWEMWGMGWVWKGWDFGVGVGTSMIGYYRSLFLQWILLSSWNINILFASLKTIREINYPNKPILLPASVLLQKTTPSHFASWNPTCPKSSQKHSLPLVPSGGVLVHSSKE